MKFTCSRQALSEAIGSVSRAVSQKSSIAALEGIKVSVAPGAVTLTGYNLEIGITTTIDANTSDTGDFVVSTRLFSEFTRRMTSEEVSFEIDDSHIINLSSGSTECSFSAAAIRNTFSDHIRSVDEQILVTTRAVWDFRN